MLFAQGSLGCGVGSLFHLVNGGEKRLPLLDLNFFARHTVSTP